MVHAKYYETTSKFVKVMPRIVLWLLFSGLGVYLSWPSIQLNTSQRCHLDLMLALNLSKSQVT